MSQTVIDNYDYHDQLIIAHAVFASLTAFVLLPTAVLIARYLRTNKIWFKIHQYVSMVEVLLMIIVFALGTRAVGYNGHGDQFTGKKSDTHHRFGLATFLLFMLQGIFGYLSHFTTPGAPPAGWPKNGSPPLPARGKSIVRYAHAFCGIVVAGCLYGTIYSGFHEWDISSDNGTATPTGVRVVYWVVLLTLATAYFLGFLLRRGREAISGLTEKGLDSVEMS